MIRRRLPVVSKVHRAAGKPNPAVDPSVTQLWRGILRTNGEAPRGKKPLLIQHVRRMVDSLAKMLQGDRDRALLLGFARGLRRRELVALDVEDRASKRSRKVSSFTFGGAKPSKPARASERASRSEQLPKRAPCVL
jgi:hypothetical protein